MIPRLAVLAMVGAWACSASPGLAGSFTDDQGGAGTWSARRKKV